MSLPLWTVVTTVRSIGWPGPPPQKDRRVAVGSSVVEMQSCRRIISEDKFELPGPA